MFREFCYQGAYETAEGFFRSSKVEFAGVDRLTLTAKLMTLKKPRLDKSRVILMEKWAVVWGVGKIDPSMRRDTRERRDVGLHKEFLAKHGAVFWSAGWERCYTKEGLVGYLYIAEEGVKHKLKIEKIVRREDVLESDKCFIPKCRDFDEWKETPTWIKITDIKDLRESLDPSTIRKYRNREPIGKGDSSRAASALQSAVRILDENWE